MMRHINTTNAVHGYWWNTSYRFFTLLALLVGAAYLYTMGQVISNAPFIDGAIQSFFTILYWQDGNTLVEKLTNTWWTYAQHRVVFSKAFNLSLYAISGSIDIYIVGMFGNAILVALVCGIAYNGWQHKTPSYNIVISALFILTAYHWPVSIWPECALIYFAPITLSYLTLILLDLPRPQVMLACLFCWLSAFTMVNGLLTTITGSIVIALNMFFYRRYSHAQIAFWAISSALCLIVYFTTTDIFSTDLLNARTAQDIFREAPRKAIGFLESLGSAPFIPYEYRAEKIALGTIVLTTSIALLTSRTSWKNPPIIGLLLFATGTIFFMSIFRFSSGTYNGYQVFTTINYATLFSLASSHIKQKNWLVPSFLLLTAILFNLNALWLNFDAMKKRQKEISTALHEFLVTGNPNTKSWLDVILREAIDKNIYRPLQSNNTFPIVTNTQPIDHCISNPETKGELQTQTGEKAFAILTNIKIPDSKITTKTQALLCNSVQSYRITLSEINIQQNTPAPSLRILLDKRAFIPGEYQVQIKTGSDLLALPETLTIAPVAPWNRAKQDCETVQKDFSRWKSAFPLVNHYCKQVSPQ